MSTNYYIREREPCKCCGHKSPELHIGKSSGGWYFSLATHDTPDIQTLGDWMLYWADRRIVDEYGVEVSSKEMLAIITARRGSLKALPADYGRYTELGDYGLLRHSSDDPYLIMHGKGPYSLFSGEFS